MNYAHVKIDCERINIFFDHGFLYLWENHVACSLLVSRARLLVHGVDVKLRFLSTDVLLSQRRPLIRAISCSMYDFFESMRSAFWKHHWPLLSRLLASCSSCRRIPISNPLRHHSKPTPEATTSRAVLARLMVVHIKSCMLP